MRFSEYLKNRRGSYPQGRFAKEIGIPQSTLSLFERGGIPSWKFRSKLATALGISSDELGEMLPNRPEADSITELTAEELHFVANVAEKMKDSLPSFPLSMIKEIISNRRKQSQVKMKIIMVWMLLVIATPCSAQDTIPQSRIIAHPTIDITDHWFVDTWVIGNFRIGRPDNYNLFAGLGFRQKNWWADAMVQRQWNLNRNLWMIDLRWQGQVTAATSVYVELSPFLSRKAFYEFVYFHQTIWRKVAIGLETENIHQPGRDSVGLGPRLFLPLYTTKGYQVGLAASHEFRRKEPNWSRIFLAFHSRSKF